MIIWTRNVTSNSATVENRITSCTYHSQPWTVITMALSCIPSTFCTTCLTITYAQVLLWWMNYVTTLFTDVTSQQRPDLPIAYESYSFGPLITRNLTRKNEMHSQIMKITIQTTGPDLCWCCCCCSNKLIKMYAYTGCPGGNVPDFRRMFLTLKYTDITQNTYIWSWMVMEIMAREVWKYDSCYTLTAYQIHIKTGRNT